MATPYTVSVPDAALAQLKEKLSLSRLPYELENSGWGLGSPLRDVERLAAYWRDGFDWRAQEKKINALPNFRTKVPVKGFGEVDLHFLHQQSGVRGAIPLLFVHGWPGNFLEVTKLLPLLGGGDGKPAFDVVAPSLPNFGFSGGVTERGFTLGQYAEACNGLMASLGYEQYVTQGGDWGTFISRVLGLLYPTRCLASHLNLVRGLKPTFAKHPILALQHRMTPYTAAEKAGIARSQWFERESTGYRMVQSTRPQTLGYSLADSPVGLLGWIYEKLHDWSDAYPWTDDEVLTWVSIYWFSTAGPAASLRIYYESTHDAGPTSRLHTSKWIPSVKLGLGYFPKELGVPPRTWGRTLGPVVFEGEHDKGGHFAAWERPQDIADDLNKMFGRGGPCAGIIKGRDGYGGGGGSKL